MKVEARGPQVCLGLPNQTLLYYPLLLVVIIGKGVSFLLAQTSCLSTRFLLDNFFSDFVTID